MSSDRKQRQKSNISIADYHGYDGNILFMANICVIPGPIHLKQNCCKVQCFHCQPNYCHHLDFQKHVQYQSVERAFSLTRVYAK